MRRQPPFRQPRGNGVHHLVRLLLAAAMDYRIIGIARKGTLREVTLHPDVKRVVHEQIHQDRTDNATNNRANCRVKLGLRISRERLAPWSRSCSDVDVDLVLEMVAPADRKVQLSTLR